MKTITVHIREVDKGGRNLTLQNLRDEVVGFMYRQTVSKATRADMQFYILLFYASVSSKNITALEAILDEAIPKFEKFTDALRNRQGYLRRNEYAEMKVQYGLEDLFYKDLFFVITSAVINIEEIESRFQDILQRDEVLAKLFKKLKQDYKPSLQILMDRFAGSRIQDTRIDDAGNTHDLSKSVYRTVFMRSSRNLELNLQRYTSVKKIESNSPVDLTFLQHVDPNTLLHLWDKYDVARYMTSTVKGAVKVSDSNLGSAILGGLVVAIINERRTNGALDRIAKNEAKKILEIEKSKHRKPLDELNTRLVKSVLDSNDALKEEVRKLKSELLIEARRPRPARDDEVMKNLSERISRLESLVVTTEVNDEEDSAPPQLL